MPLRLRSAGGGSVKLSSPVALATDVAMEVPGYDGAKLLTNKTPGVVLQVVQSVATAYTGIATTTETAITDLSATITPSSSTSKILVMVTIGELRSPTTTAARFQLYRNGSKIRDAINELGYGLNSSSSIGMALSWNYLDSPSTTSAITYALYGRCLVVGGAGPIQIMPNGASTSSVILMEIAA